jgi:cytochrome P450
MIARLDELIVRRAEAILTPVLARGECDFVRDVAYLLPMHLIADMVGIPEDDRPHVFGITDRFMRAGDPRSGLTPEARMAAQLELFQYAQALGEEKRRHPADDLWSLLAVAEVDDGEGGRVRLTGYELDLFFLLLSVAGSETTRNATSHGLLALLERPDQLAALRADPGLLETGADEIVRWASPVTCFTRAATRDTTLGGAAIRAGERVALFYASANRDERAFDEPFRFDLARNPNPHVGFGGRGAHFCLGAHLARRQIRTMFERLLARTDAIEPTAVPTWVAGGPDQSVAVSLDRLPVRLRAA